MEVISWSRSTVVPRASAFATANSRSGVGVRQARSSSSSSIAPNTGSCGSNPARPVSSDRIAFWSDSGNVRPIAITSPTDCIIVPSTGSAPGSFSNAQRGTLVTT